MNVDVAILYSIVSFFYVISPGPAVFLALANGMSADMRAVLLSSLGNIVGLLFLSTISIIGLGSLILTSAKLFLLVKIIGAAYLIYLGLKQFKSSQVLINSDLKIVSTEKRTHPSYFFEGFFLASTNPKPILFFIAIFPQFLKIELSLVPQFLIMTSIFMVISFLLLFSYGYAAKKYPKLTSVYRLYGGKAKTP
jgi:threonine/homoserine/homoserine lactone efflux protein